MTERRSWARLPHIAILLVFAAFAPGLSLAVVSPAPPPSAPPADTLVVQGLGKFTAELGGKWQFKTGDDMAWASPEFDDSGWEKIGVDRGWGTQGHFGYTGYAWYRRHIDFVPVAGAPPDLALFIQLVNGPYEVYWNGTLVGRMGRLPPHPMWYFRPPPHSFGLGPVRSGVLAFRVWKAPMQFTDSGEAGGLIHTPLAGSGSAVAAELGAADHEWLRDRQYYFDLYFLLYGLVALLGLLAWLRDRKQIPLLCIALFTLTQPVHVLLFNAHVPWPADFASGFDRVISSALQNISLWFLLLYLLDLNGNTRLRRWTRVLAILCAAGGFLDWFVINQDWTGDWSGGYETSLQVASAVLSLSLSLVSLYPLVLIAFALGKRLTLASWLVAGFASLSDLLLLANIIAIQGLRYTRWTFSDWVEAHLFTINGNYFNAQNISTGLLLISIVYAVHRYLVEQSDRQGALEQEFRSAQEVQRILIPAKLPPLPGYAVTSAYIPAQEVGGDFFQLIPQADGAALLVLGDVSGKGLKAAMTVSLLVGALRTLAETFSDPAEILAGLNRRLEGRLQNGFVTCLVLRLEVNGACKIANSGHLSPFLNDRELELPPALPLGIVRDAAFETIATHLGVGDRLTLYTDGLLEARKPSGELYGFDRVRELIATQPDAHAASEAAVAFGQDDDITVLTVTRLALGVESTTRLVAPELVSAV